MKKFTIIFLFLALIAGLKGHAQSKIWIYGFVYENGNDDKQTLIPFATISYYSYENQSELKYFAMSGPMGNYLIKPYNYQAKYHVVVTAPGYKTVSFNLKEIPEVWNGKPFSGNASINVCMIKDVTETAACIPHVYTMKQFDKQKKAKILGDLFTQMPEIKKEGSDLLTQQDGSIRLFVNGESVTGEICNQIDQLPVSVLSKIEYYALPKGGVYEGVLNIILNVGETVNAPSYRLKGNSFTF